MHTEFYGEITGNRPLRRPRRKCENNTKMDLKEVGWGCIDWIHVV